MQTDSVPRDAPANFNAERGVIAPEAVGVVVTDPSQPDNPIVWTNEAFVTITGFTTEQATGRNCRFLQGPGTDREAVARIRQAIVDRRAISETLLNYRSDGRPFWNQLQVTPVLDEDGKLSHFVGIQTVVAEPRVRAAAPTRPGGVPFMELDREGRMVRVNQAVSQILGLASDGLLGKRIWDLMDEPDRESSRRKLADLRSGSRSMGTVLRVFRRGDGSLAQVLVTFRVLRNADGAVTGFVDTLESLDRLQPTEAQLRETMAALATQSQHAKHTGQEARAMLDAASEAMIFVDPQGHLLRVNQQFQTLFGIEPGVVIGHRLEELRDQVNRVFADPRGFRALVTGSAADDRNTLGTAVRQAWTEQRELALF